MPIEILLPAAEATSSSRIRGPLAHYAMFDFKNPAKDLPFRLQPIVASTFRWWIMPQGIHVASFGQIHREPEVAVPSH